MNGDRYNRGRRIFATGSYALPSELTLSWFYGRAVGNDFAVVNKHRFNLAVGYNVLKALQRAFR